MNVTVTLDATPALLDAINNLAGALGNKAAANEASTAPKTKKPTKVVDAEPEATQTAAPEQKAEPVVPEASTDGKAISLEECRKAAMANKEKAKKLLSEWGFQNMTSLPAEKYGEFIQTMQAA